MEENWDDDNWDPKANTAKNNRGDSDRPQNSGGYNQRNSDRSSGGYNDRQSDRSNYNDRKSDYKSDWNDRNDRNDRTDRNDRNDRNGRTDRNDRNDDRRGYGQSSSGGDEPSETIEIDQSKVGMVIGRGGSKIREIEERFSVSVNVDKNSNSNGMASVIIKGSAENIQNAKSHIAELTSNENGGGYRSSDQGQRQRSDRPQYGNNDGDATVMEIDPSKVGMVIGRGGCKIREIEEKFKVSLKVERNQNDNGLATVMIRGNEADVGNAITDIKTLVGEPDRQQNTYNNTNNSTESYTNDTNDFPIIDWQAAAKQSEEENMKKWAKLPPIVKNFYKEHAEVAKMSPNKVDYIREQNNNTTVGRVFSDEPLSDVPIPNPVETFEQCFSEYPDLLHEIKKAGFEKPSPIQSQAWPVLLKGEDLIGIAQTGTGKTLAFLLPAMIHTEYQTTPRGQRGGPNVLVLAPTRELAQQIEKEVGKYQFRSMKAVCVYGGGDRKAQINSVEAGVEIVIATPGRLNDLIEANIIDVTSITYLVLDEADRMLDMGFEPQIRKFLLNIRPDRQTVMTSATWPSGVRRLAQKYMQNPIQVCVGSLDLAAVHSVEQVIEILDENDKFDRIMDFVKNMSKSEKAIIFCGKKARADDLSSEISLQGIAVQCIHGDREQSDREQALADIKEGLVSILIATDVASRGIDIGDITHVINYDFPRNIEEYVHRVGRTGRAGKTGTSISYVTRSDWGSAEELIKILEEANQDVPEELRDMKKRFESMKERKDRERSSFGGGGGGRRGGGGGYGGGGGGYGGGGGGGYGGGGGGSGRSGGGRRY